MNDVNFTFYQDQVTALIGPNGAFEGFPQTSRPTHLSFLLGAGKSTLLNLITGLISPTPGDCTIDGASIKHDTQRARQSIGICPQNDGLYGILTVRENIEFFLRVKGAGYTENEVKQQANEVGLSESFHKTAFTLSNGNKRKLSLALPRCGDPRFLILDEPTCGVGTSICVDFSAKAISNSVASSGMAVFTERPPRPSHHPGIEQYGRSGILLR